MVSDSGTTQVYMHPREAVRRLVELELVRGLDDAKLDALREECWDGSEEQLEEAGLLAIITFHYETVEKGAQDGWVWHADQFWHDTDDAVAELSAALRLDKPLFKQVETETRDDALLMELERDDGQRKQVEARSLEDLVNVFNEELRARGATKRLIELDTGGEWQMFVALELKTARKCVAEGALPVADIDALS